MGDFEVCGWTGWRLALVLAAFCGPACAQMASPGEVPRALKDIKPAPAACRPDKVEPIHAPSGARSDIAPDLACAISAAELYSALGRPDTVLIDVRPASEYGSFRIGGALNMGVAETRSKAYLRSKRLVLVGDGKGERELYAACAALKRDGFKQVRTLRGGIASWVADERPVIGRAPSPDRLIRLSAAELWRESQFDGNVVLVAENREPMLADLPFAAALGLPSVETVRAALEERRKRLKNAPLASVVLIADAGLAPEQLATLQQALRPVPLLMYAETRDALNRYVTLQKAIWAAQARGPKQPGCGS
jgi:rhodanese-related sulfurtransferase